MRGMAVFYFVAALAFCSQAAAQGSMSSQDDKTLEQKSSGGTETAPPAVDDEELSPVYSGLGLQKVHAKFNNVKDAINLDILAFGFRIPTAPWFAIELNLGFTMIPGQIDQSSAGSSSGCGGLLQPPCPGATTSSSDFSATTAGAFAVLRSTGSAYLMGKYGYRYMNTSLDELQNDRSGTGWGAGVGYRWNKKGSYAEFGYTHIADQIDALGFSFSFSYDRR